nr:MULTISPECIES: alkaline phosphatase family protein [unclassified Salinibacterium]
MLPATKTHRMSLADVVPNCLDSLAGRQGRMGLAPVDRAIVVLVDGLGHAVLSAHSGYARTLAARLPHDPAIGSGFPSTTVAGLTTLTTGQPAGRHGLIGYRALDPEHDRVINQLSGWEGLDPRSWQREATLFELSASDGVRSTAITHPRYRDSEMTRAVLRGATFVGAATADERVARLRDELARPGPALIYYYVNDLDAAGHAHGIDSAQWVAALEDLDAEIRDAVRLLGPKDGLVITADHGMVDVPERSHRIPAAALLDGVRHIAGEPRCLQLHVEDGVDVDALAERWRASEGKRAWIATKTQAIEAGWFGEVHPEVAPRIGDLLVAARGDHAYYVDPEDRARSMIGQHGSITPAELAIPLLRFGAFAR